jgi:hypothetical protein
MTPGAGLILTQEAKFEQHYGRVPIDDTIYQISKL